MVRDYDSVNLVLYSLLDVLGGVDCFIRVCFDTFQGKSSYLL